jgi:hypothetical protein
MNFFSSILGDTYSANIVNGSENSQAVFKIYNSFCDPIPLVVARSNETALIEDRANKIYGELIALSGNDKSKIRKNYESFLKKCDQYFQEKENEWKSGRDESTKSNIALGIQIRKEILEKFNEQFSQHYPDSIFDIFSRNIALTISGNHINEQDAIDKRVEEMYKALIGSPPINIEEIKRNYQNFLTESEKYFEEKNRLSQGNIVPEDRNKISMGIEIRQKIFKKFEKKFLSLVSEVAKDDLTLVSPRSDHDGTSLNHNPHNVSVASNQAIDGGVFEESLANMDSNYPLKYGEKDCSIKKQLEEMQNSQNPKDDIFFKNYLLKHLELIKLYEDGKEVMVEKFKKAGKGLESVDQEFNQLENEARKECLDFLLANSSNLQNFEINNPTKDQYLEKQKFELYKEISKLRSLLSPPIFNPLRSPSYNSSEKRVINYLLLNQQSVLINSLQPPFNRPSNLPFNRPSNLPFNRPSDLPPNRALDFSKGTRNL